MALFGAHMSVAGGHYKALLSAVEQKCQAVQLFTKNSNQWNATLFRRTLRRTGIGFPMAHSSYLLNLASPDEALYRRSIAALLIEMSRAEQLGLRYLIIHPGCHMGAGENAGLVRIVGALDEVHGRCAGFRVRILLDMILETPKDDGSVEDMDGVNLQLLRSLLKEPSATRNEKRARAGTPLGELGMV
jgi:deoxyribonuclease IV